MGPQGQPGLLALQARLGLLALHLLLLVQPDLQGLQGRLAQPGRLARIQPFLARLARLVPLAPLAPLALPGRRVTSAWTAQLDLQGQLVLRLLFQAPPARQAQPAARAWVALQAQLALQAYLA